MFMSFGGNYEEFMWVLCVKCFNFLGVMVIWLCSVLCGNMKIKMIIFWFKVMEVWVMLF